MVSTEELDIQPDTAWDRAARMPLDILYSKPCVKFYYILKI